MPGGDRTGPAGAGPMTGRAAGFCGGYPVPGYMNPVGGRGFWGRGGGRGGGRGLRHWYYATGVPGWARGGFGYPGGPGANPYAVWAGPAAPTITPEQELEGLRRQARHLQDTIGQINERIEQLQAEANPKDSV